MNAPQPITVKPDFLARLQSAIPPCPLFDTAIYPEEAVLYGTDTRMDRTVSDGVVYFKLSAPNAEDRHCFTDEDQSERIVSIELTADQWAHVFAAMGMGR